MTVYFLLFLPDVSIHSHMSACLKHSIRFKTHPLQFQARTTNDTVLPVYSTMSSRMCTDRSLSTESHSPTLNAENLAATSKGLLKITLQMNTYIFQILFATYNVGINVNCCVGSLLYTVNYRNNLVCFFSARDTYEWCISNIF